MASDAEPIRILVVRPWTLPLHPLRAALRAAGVEVRLHRVDIEPALNAAIERGDVEVVILDPAVRTVTRATVEARLAQHRRTVPLVILEDLATIGPAVRCALAVRRN